MGTILLSCTKMKWNQTTTGLKYKIYTSDTSKEKPVYGDFIWMHLQKISPEKKELFNTKIFEAKDGVEMEYKKPLKETDVTTIFSLMGKGDSAIVKIPAKIIDNNHPKRGDYSYKLNLISFKKRATYEAEKQEQFSQQLILDSLAIIDYLSNKRLSEIRRDTFGNFFLINQEGIGKLITEGDTVTIHYIGKLLDGVVFDNSYDRKQTLQFIAGNKQVIKGLDKGIQNFHIGDKGMLIIPSRLAYTDKEVGKIPPNSILIFELEIIK